jgi:hypothetical protein
MKCYQCYKDSSANSDDSDHHDNDSTGRDIDNDSTGSTDSTGNLAFTDNQQNNCATKESMHECSLLSGGGLPQIFMEYWERDQLRGQPCVSSSSDFVANYMLYGFNGGGAKPGPPPGAVDIIIPELDAEIRKLHKYIGNAETEG